MDSIKANEVRAVFQRNNWKAHKYHKISFISFIENNKKVFLFAHSRQHIKLEK